MKPTADLEVGLMSAVKTLKGVTLALVGFGQSSRVARRGVQRAKGRKKGRRGMRKCIFWGGILGCDFLVQGRMPMEGDRKIRKRYWGEAYM